MRTRRWSGIDSLNDRAPSLVAIGNFDGVHRGHQALVGAALREAQERHLRPLVLTFDPHPAAVLGRGARPLLTTTERKVALLLHSDPALHVIVEPFTVELSRLSPAVFAERMLAAGLHAQVVIVGENFRFGHERAGDLATLQSLGQAFGFRARPAQLEGDAEGLFSSTRIREALKAGDLARAERCLGRPHSLSGTVVGGDGRGRTIGVPTANLDAVSELLPPHGVYACLVDREDGPGRGVALSRGVLNVGVRPTVAAGFSIEVHLLDFSADLYGAKLRVHLVARLRDEMRFSGLEALTKQIGLDIAEARERLGGLEPAAHGAWA